jgi:hypothetical protein
LLIMVYVPGWTASVVTTCIAVSIFAVQLAVWSSMTHLVEISDLRLFRFFRGTGLKFGSFERRISLVSLRLCSRLDGICWNEHATSLNTWPYIS